jgi:hypothetical protein
MRFFRLAVLGALGVATVIACTGEDPLPTGGVGANPDGSADGPGSGNDGGTPLPRGPISVLVVNAFDDAPMPGIVVVGANPSGDRVPATTDSAGEAKLEIESGASVSVRIIIDGQATKVVTYAGVEPGDGLRIEAVPSLFADRIFPDVVAAPSGGDHGLSLCQPRGSYYGVTPGTVSTIGVRDNPCRIKTDTPIFFFARPTPPEPLTHGFFVKTPSARDASVRVRAFDWAPAESVRMVLKSPLAVPVIQGAQALFRGAYFKEELVLYQDEQVIDGQNLDAGLGAISLAGIPRANFDEWERSILVHVSQTQKTYQSGSVVRAVVNTVSEDPATNLPLVTTATLAGPSSHPELTYLTDGRPIENVTGIEVFLSDNPDEQTTNPQGLDLTGTKYWVVRMAVTNPTSPIQLPEMPPEFASLAAGSWKHIELLFLRNETFTDPKVFRSVPTRLQPPNGDRRLTQHLHFPANTKLRVAGLQSTL